MAKSGVRTIYLKEMRDILRDRRTLVSMILIPILLMPVMMLGIGAIMEKRIQSLQAEKSQIAWLGGDAAADIRSLLENRDDLGLLTGVEDTTVILTMLREKELDAAVSVPPGFDPDVEAFITGEQPTPPVLIVYSDQTREKSRFAVDKIKSAATTVREKRADQLLQSRGLTGELLKPFLLETINIVSEKKMGMMFVSMFLPYILIIQVLTGAMYPAIDLTAGEKERGTLETLLVSGVSRFDIVSGKFLTVLSAAMVTSALSMMSMVVSFRYTASLDTRMAKMMNIQLDLPAVLMILAAMIPLAVIFSATLMAISLFAKSYREAQTYVTPLMFVVIVPSMASLIPDADLSLWMASIPVMNVSLLLKQALMGTMTWAPLAMTMGVNSLIAAGALVLVTQMFRRESVLFRI